MKLITRLGARRCASGLTLTEVVMSVAIGSVVFGGVLLGYVQSARQAEWTAYNLAAQSLAVQRLEAARAAKWDTQSAPPVDRLVATNFPPVTDVLDVPLTGSGSVQATSTVSITLVSADPPLKMIEVETVWPFRSRGVFTNTTASYRAPDQ